MPRRTTTEDQDLLRIAVGGSVDHGKSSLIGRLLLDAEALKGDQIDEVSRGELAHATDGLRAEREQGITIDVAYRYFSTPNRGFVVADTPGHTRYTRNMVTGASTADLLLLVVDARPPGLTEQSLRHVQLAHLLGIEHLVVAVNKIELMDFDEDAVRAVEHEIAATARRLGLKQATVVPVSALEGDNVVTRSKRTPWYHGPPLLEVLEGARPQTEGALVAPLRFPVQWIARHASYRGLSGQVSGGLLRAGDRVKVLPSGESTTIARIDSFDGPITDVRGPLGGTVVLEDNLDVARGDMLVPADDPLEPAREVDATLVWLGPEPLTPGRRYLLKHTTRRVRATVSGLRTVYNVSDVALGDASELRLNEVGEVTLRLATPIVADPYEVNQTTGAFILIDELSHDTVAAGMVRETRSAISEEEQKSPDVVWHPGKLDRTERWTHLGAKGATIWLTGMPASGKSTISTALEQALVHRGQLAYLLDGDNVRHGLSGDLGFDAASRAENVRRVGHVARFFADAGGIAVVALVSPFRQDRDLARRLHEKAGLPFLEVFVDTPLEECARRDPKGLYARAKAGRLSGLTGQQNPYEAPPSPEVTIKTLEESVESAVGRLIELLDSL
ncbi:MAG: adenylyl-sulfate kinase [Solirubrobacteraceae bacterium]|nr:adenylyl-sulfate kinase [Solirubrobacteraceae bacterium]